MDNPFHCKYCGRWLAIVHEDGKIDLAGKASIQFDSKVRTDIKEEQIVIPERNIVVTDNSWKCKFRRVLKRKKKV